MVKKWILIIGGVVAVVLLAVGIGLWILYRAAAHVPEAYTLVLEADSALLEEASDQMLQQTAALASSVKQEGDWQAIFTAAQINGWLAVDMRKNHPKLLPAEVSDPRVVITPGELTVYCRLDHPNWQGVVALSVDAYLSESNVLAVQIRRARIGRLPLPLKGVLEEISTAAAELDLNVRWQQASGDPVALVTFPTPRNENDQRVEIESIELGDGQLYLSGSTSR